MEITENNPTVKYLQLKDLPWSDAGSIWEPIGSMEYINIGIEKGCRTMSYDQIELYDAWFSKIVECDYCSKYRREPCSCEKEIKMGPITETYLQLLELPWSAKGTLWFKHVCSDGHECYKPDPKHRYDAPFFQERDIESYKSWFKKIEDQEFPDYCCSTNQ